MILQALVKYYETLVKNGKLAPIGWGTENVSYSIEIDIDGNICGIVSRKQLDDETGKSSPQKMIVPVHKGRSGTNPKPYFLCDNVAYMLGIIKMPQNEEESKKAHEKATAYLKAAAKYHIELLQKIDEPCAVALRNFFLKWDPSDEKSVEVLNQYMDLLLKNENVIFSYNGEDIHRNPEIERLWNEYCSEDDISSDEDEKICMITGKKDMPAITHIPIKGIWGANPSGARLVSFDKGSPAYTSFEKEQGLNAPIGNKAMFAYTTALNYLIEKSDKRQCLSNAAGNKKTNKEITYLVWAESGEKKYEDLYTQFLFGGSYHEDELKKMVIKICRGESFIFDEKYIDVNEKFYVLGLSPNNARISVRFFKCNSFGNMIKNIQLHQERLRIEKNGKKLDRNISIWQIIRETYREGGEASPLLSGELVRSIVENTRYPATIINAIDMRIRADRKINDIRAAMIKAYYLKNDNIYVPKEVLTVALNKDTDNVAYNLGRLFAILEKIQNEANPGLNATIKDKFFVSASSVPARIFPNLINLSQNHLRKIGGGLRIHYEKQIGEIMDKISSFPAILNMPERGAFLLGYYHQEQELYKGKKELKED